MADHSAFPIDVDAEAIYVDGNWYTRDDLARRIKAMLEQGDFNVARPSTALEHLTHSVASLRTVAFRAPAELSEALSAIAQRMGVSVGHLLRESAMRIVQAERREITTRSAMPQMPEPHQLTSPAQPVATQQQPPAPGQVVAGPGALRASGLDPDLEAPVDLGTPKKAGPVDESSAEHRWFKS